MEFGESVIAVEEIVRWRRIVEASTVVPKTTINTGCKVG